MTLTETKMEASPTNGIGQGNLFRLVGFTARVDTTYGAKNGRFISLAVVNRLREILGMACEGPGPFPVRWKPQ